MAFGEQLDKLDYKTTAIMVLIGVVLGGIYSLFINNLLLAIVAMEIAVFGTYFIFASFFEEEKPLKLMEGEKPILTTLDLGYILFPKRGGFMTTKSERDLTIHLTNKRIAARKSKGEIVFDKPLESISKVREERRIMTKYLRVTYYEDGKEKDALLFVGDTEKWLARLGELGIGETDSFDTMGEDNHKKFMTETKTLKRKVEKKKKS